MDILNMKMKFKTIYFYGIVIVAVIVVLLFASMESTISDSDTINSERMPQDEIHSNISGQLNQSPGSSNVTSETMHKLDVLKKAVTKNPDDTLRLREYADFLTMAHKPMEAIPHYEKILDVDDERTDVLFSLTFIYYNKGDMLRAEELTNKILSFDPGNQMAIYNAGAIHASRGNKSKAREIWTKLIEDFPGSETTQLAKNSLNRL
jgi:tetratricopeptide (TPR) repeat protein